MYCFADDCGDSTYLEVRYFNETGCSGFVFFFFSRGSVSACFARGIVCSLVNNPFILILLEHLVWVITTGYDIILIFISFLLLLKDYSRS